MKITTKLFFTVIIFIGAKIDGRGVQKISIQVLDTFIDLFEISHMQPIGPYGNGSPCET